MIPQQWNIEWRLPSMLVQPNPFMISGFDNTFILHAFRCTSSGGYPRCHGQSGDPPIAILRVEVTLEGELPDPLCFLNQQPIRMHVPVCKIRYAFWIYHMSISSKVITTYACVGTMRRKRPCSPPRRMQGTWITSRSNSLNLETAIPGQIPNHCFRKCRS